MKQFVSLMAVLVALAALTACGESNTNNPGVPTAFDEADANFGGVDTQEITSPNDFVGGAQVTVGDTTYLIGLDQEKVDVARYTMNGESGKNFADRVQYCEAYRQRCIDAIRTRTSQIRDELVKLGVTQCLATTSFASQSTSSQATSVRALTPLEGAEISSLQTPDNRYGRAGRILVSTLGTGALVGGLGPWLVQLEPERWDQFAINTSLAIVSIYIYDVVSAFNSANYDTEGLSATSIVALGRALYGIWTDYVPGIRSAGNPDPQSTLTTSAIDTCPDPNVYTNFLETGALPQ